MPFNPEMVMNFAIVGISANFAMIVFTFILTAFKAATLKRAELEEVIKFFRTRKSMINNNNDQLTLLVSNLFVFLPFYTAWIYTVYAWYLIMRPGMWGMISASVKADGFSIIQLVRYEFVSLKDK